MISLTFFPFIIAAIVIGMVLYSYQKKKNEANDSQSSNTTPNARSTANKTKPIHEMKPTVTNSMESRLVPTHSTIDISSEDETSIYETDSNGNMINDSVNTGVFNQELVYSQSVDEQGEVVMQYNLDSITASIVLGQALGSAKYRSKGKRR